MKVKILKKDIIIVLAVVILVIIWVLKMFREVGDSFLVQYKDTNLFFDEEYVAVSEIDYTDFSAAKSSASSSAEEILQRNPFRDRKAFNTFPDNILKIGNREYLTSPFTQNKSYEIFDYGAILITNDIWDYGGDSFYFNVENSEIKKISNAAYLTRNTKTYTHKDYVIVTYSDVQYYHGDASSNREDVISVFSKDKKMAKLAKYVRSSHYDAFLDSFFWYNDSFYFKLDFRENGFSPNDQHDDKYFALKITNANFREENIFHEDFKETVIDRDVTGKTYKEKLALCDQIETLVYGSNNIAVDEFLRVSCKTSLAIKEGDEKFCDNNGVDKDKCYFGMAFVKKDLGMCNRISGRPGEVVGSYYDYLDRREVCKLNILEKETISNPNLCRQLGSEFIIEECIMNSVIINKDENVCGMLSSSSVYLKPDACIEAIKSNKE